MIDENYHIEDIDEVGKFSSMSNNRQEEEQTIKTKIIYENTTSSNDKQEDKEIDSFFYNKEQDRKENENQKEFRDKEEFSNLASGNKNYIANWIRASYEARPNTLKATIVGLILALLILFIGFLKTLLIFIVVLLANIIGQLLDSNPRLLYVINLIRQRFR